MLTKKDEARYRAISKQLAKMRERGWNENTHPDFELLQKEHNELADKMTND